MNGRRETPAGKADSKRGYLWVTKSGDWTFGPDPELRTLTIYQETAGGVHAVEQLRFNREGEDLVIQVPEQSHRLRLQGWYDGHETRWRVHKIQYRSGLTATVRDDDKPWDWVRLSELVSGGRHDLPQRDAPAGTSVPAGDGRETVAPRTSHAASRTPMDGITHGTDRNDDINTGTGPKRVYAGAGDDRIVVNHQLSGSLPSDNKYIRGGPGNDTVDYKSAFDSHLIGIDASLKTRLVTWGTSGHDRLVNVENIIGTVAADRFEGDAKDNVMTGLGGNDVYVVTRGGGKDEIVDLDAADGNVDTILFGPGIRREDLRVSVAGNDVMVEVLAEDGGADTVTTIRNGVLKASAIERLQLDDGTIHEWRDLAGLSPLAPEPMADDGEMADEQAPSLVEDDGRKTTYLGTDGNDMIWVGALHDKVLAGPGDDRIRVSHAHERGAPQNKEIHGGRGNDTVDYLGSFGVQGGGIYVTLDQETVTWGRGGEDRVIGVENIRGTDAADRFEGDAKDNVMTGGKGNDCYVVTFGGGKDEILDHDDTGGHVDTLLFGEGIRPDLLLKRMEGPDLVIQLLRKDGQYDTRVTVRNGSQRDFAIERFVLADGSQFQLDILGSLPFPVI